MEQMQMNEQTVVDVKTTHGGMHTFSPRLSDFLSDSDDN